MTDHVVESTSELSAFMKAGVMAGSERDAGFCSGGDEDDMSGLHSPSASEDSLEVQVTPISLRNKRKLAEPRKIQESNSTAPLKKRRFEQIEVTREIVLGDEVSRATRSPSPFRPWNTCNKNPDAKASLTRTSLSSDSAVSGTCVVLEDVEGKVGVQELGEEEFSSNSSRFEETRKEEESRVQEGYPPRLDRESRRKRPDSPIQSRAQTSLTQRREARQKSGAAAAAAAAAVAAAAATTTASITSHLPSHGRLQEEPLSLVLRGNEPPRVPSHPAVSGTCERNPAYLSCEPTNLTNLPSHHSHFQPHPHSDPDALHHQQQQQENSGGSSSSQSRQHPQAGGHQRNYKNMTRERRIEANARERTRVHTISAAFDTLRRAIPAYSHNQKLSKLSVLRIACSYIMTLGKIVGTPEGECENGASLGACVDLVSRTIQTEGKLRKRKDD